jgi:hypothetical protein
MVELMGKKFRKTFQFIKNLLAIVFISIITSCTHTVKTDLSGISIDLHLDRFETDLFATTPSNYKTHIDSLLKKYPELLPFYFHEIGGWNLVPDSTERWKDSILQYVQSPYSRALYDSTMLQFASLEDFKTKLTAAFRHYKYYFPDSIIPDVNSLINAPPAFTIGNNLLCVSLDKYLGSSSAFYKYESDPIPAFLLRKFRPEYMVSNCVEVVATANFEFDPAGKKLLDAMIYRGKILYFKKELLPGEPDSIVTGFSEEDLEWCKENEPEIWKFFIEHKLLYSPDPLVYSKYITDGPTTSGMPEAAPGNIGTWVGWQIVSKYMEKNRDLTLRALMNEADAQKILTDSRYKPIR